MRVLSRMALRCRCAISWNIWAGRYLNRVFAHNRGRFVSKRTGPFLELFLVDLSDGKQWHSRVDDNTLRHLVVREPLAAPRANLFRGDLRARYNECDTHFLPHRIGNTYDRSDSNRGMGFEHRFYFA